MLSLMARALSGSRGREASQEAADVSFQLPPLGVGHISQASQMQAIQDIYHRQMLQQGGPPPKSIAPQVPKPTAEIFTPTHRLPALVLSLGLTFAGLIGLGWNVSQHWPHAVQHHAASTGCATMTGTYPNRVLTGVDCLPGPQPKPTPVVDYGEETP